MDAKVVLSLENITKRYPGVLALNNVSMSFLEGEVHALLGENGAGKSTLIKAIAGAIDVDAGIVTINGHKYSKMTPSLSRSLGIEVIYQEFNLVPTLSCAENIFLGEKSENSVLFSAKEIEKKAVKVLEQEKGIKYELTAMGTIVEGDLDGILAVVKKMHEQVFGEGVARVVTTVKIDDRRDKPQGMKEKLDSLKKKL